jgi:hypothetical protein
VLYFKGRGAVNGGGSLVELTNTFWTTLCTALSYASLGWTDYSYIEMLGLTAQI